MTRRPVHPVAHLLVDSRSLEDRPQVEVGSGLEHPRESSGATTAWRWLVALTAQT